MTSISDKTSQSSRRTEFSITDRVWLAIGILLFLFFLTSTVAHLLTKKIDSEVTQHVRAVELVLEGSGEFDTAELARSLAYWRTTNTIDLAVWFLLSMTLFGVIIGISAAVVLSRGIIRPILELTAGAKAIGEGKLDHRIEIESDDEFGELAASFNLMAEKRQQIEDALREQAHHDALTKLPNQIQYWDRLAQALAQAKRHEWRFAIHLLDLDGFKEVNDTLGHPVGDELLKAVAKAVAGCIRTSDTVARIGGDEFACQWRSKKGPLRRCKKGPLGGCGLVPVVHGRAPRATRRALNRLTRRRAREGPVGPRGQAWAGWSVQLAVGV